MSTAIITLKPLAILSLMPSDTPDPVFWPDGTSTHGTAVGYTVGNWQLVALRYDDPPSRFYQESGAAAVAGLDGAVLQMVRQWQPVPLQSAKTDLLATVDAAAEVLRQTVITPGAGQAMVYLQKLAEARAFLNDPGPDSANYPLLNASMVFEGGTLAEVANFVAQTAAKWTAIAAGIEKVRLAAKGAINAAQSVDEAVAAAAVNWP